MSIPPATAGPNPVTHALPPITVEEIAALVRGSEDEMEAYFDQISEHSAIDSTKTKLRLHRFGHDATLNRPDLSKLCDKLIKLLIDFACPRAEIARALEAAQRTGSAESFSALQEKARRLFVESPTTGEPGELLLFMLTERALGYPQILCKFPLKTSENVHAHGADGVHASVDSSSGHLKLHWGEAKFRADSSKALTECLDTLVELILEPTGGAKSKRRDMELICDHISLENRALEDAILTYLNPDHKRSKELTFCGVGVIGFDLPEYDGLTTAYDAKDDAYISTFVKSWQKRVKAAMEAKGLAMVEIDIFCIPCVSVEHFRKLFLQRLG